MIYIASPYSSPNPRVMEARYRQVRAFTAALLQKKLPAFSPIVHCHTLAIGHHLPREFDFWQSYAEDMIHAAQKLYVLCLPGWEASRGVTYEIAFARKQNKHIVFYHEDGVQYKFREVDEWQQ